MNNEISPTDTQTVPPFLSKSYYISSSSLSTADIKKLFSEFERFCQRSMELEIENRTFDLVERANELESEIRDCFKITFSIKNSDAGTQIEGVGTPDFQDNIFDTDITSIFISTYESFEWRAKVKPANRAAIFIDFSRTSISLNFLTMPSNPTERKSVVDVNGIDAEWVNNTYLSISNFFEERKKGMVFLHGSGVYDAFLYLFVIPLAIFGISRIEYNYPQIFRDLTPSVTIAVYIYVWLFLANASRFAFLYSRRLFPLVEFVREGNWKQIFRKTILLAVICSIMAAAIWDVFKIFVNYLTSS